MLVFGYAVTTDEIYVATVHMTLTTVSSRELVSRFAHSGYFDIVEFVDNDDQAREAIDRERVRMILRMNKGFGANLIAGKASGLQLIVDGTDSNTAGIVLNYSSKITGEYSRQLMTIQYAKLRGAARLTTGVDMQVRAWFNSNLESRNFYVPGVIAIIVMLITLMLTSMAVVREKEIGTIEQIMVTR